MNDGLSGVLRKHIKEFGPLHIGAFMEMALAHPVYGYYMRGDPFGAGGDFTTSPEISQMFGEVIGAWTADIWMRLGAPGKFAVVECGPGRGTLMQDLLRAASGIRGFREALSVHLIEISPALKAIQQGRLSGAGAQWHSHISEVDTAAPSVVLANEFLDALPVRQLVRVPGGWRERAVGHDGNKFHFGLAEAPTQLIQLLGDNINARVSEGDIVEVSPERSRYFSEICRFVSERGGCALAIDYGHSVGASPGDTLQAVFKHQYCDVLEHVGEADLTAHVDFGSLAKIASGMGMRVCGPVGQGDFLSRIGIGLRAEKLAGIANPSQKDNIMQALARLTEPDQMGNLFKVMAVTDQQDFELAGFR